MKNSVAIIWTTAMLLLAVCINAAEVINAGNYAEVEARYNGEWSYPQSALASNVYSKVKQLYADHSSPFDFFITVRGGGVDLEMPTANFFEFASFVSNNCSAIAADWPTYETNEMVRFTTLSAVAYSGFDRMTNLADRVLAGYEANTNYCGWDTIRFVNYPYGASTNKYYLTMNYEQPAVSNIISRLRALAVARGDEGLREMCDERLSGEAKRNCLESIQIGDW